MENSGLFWKVTENYNFTDKTAKYVKAQEQGIKIISEQGVQVIKNL